MVILVMDLIPTENRCCRLSMLPVLTDMLTDAGNRSDVRRFLILTILCRNVTLVWKLLLFKKEKNMANMINRNR